MDRTIVYAGQQPTDTVWLSAERNKMVALAYMAQATFGTPTVVDGLACIPTVPASLAVQIGNGSIYTLTSLDPTAYGSMSLDAVDQIVKQGIALSVPNLTLTPPGTSGQAINYLIQAELVEQDTGVALLPYFNSAQPLVPFNGPNGSGTSQPTVRQCTLVVQAKAGVAATAGSQVTPSPDAGFVGLYAVTVANGATALTSAQITQLATAPFLSVKLPQVPTWVQAGSYLRGADTGTANAMVVTLSPVPTAPPALLLIRKAAVANSGAMTISVNNTVYSLLNSDGSALIANEMSSNFLALLGYDGTSYRFLNSGTTTAVGSLTANAGEGISVTGSAVVALNVPSLAPPTAPIAATDLFAFFSQGDTHHRGLPYSSLKSKLATDIIPNPTKSLTTPGYFIIPGGLILQWGYQAWPGATGSVAGEGNNKLVNFPIAFPTACVYADATIDNSINNAYVDIGMQIYSLTTSGMNLFAQFMYNAGATQPPGFWWFAIGY